MVKNFFVVCGVCGCAYRIRVQAGYVNDYSASFHCTQCGNRIDGAVHLDPSCALVDFRLGDGSVASLTDSAENVRALVELSGELPSFKMSSAGCGCMISPYMRAASVFRFDELKEHISELEFCLDYYRTDWPTVRTALQLFNDENDGFAAEMLLRCEKKLLEEDCSEWPLLNRIYCFSWTGLPMVADADARKRAKEVTARVRRLQVDALADLAGFYLASGVTGRHVLAETLEVFDQVAKAYPSLVNGFTFLKANGGYSLEEYGSYSCTPEDLKDLYCDEYELIGRLMVLFIGLDNIVRDGAFDAMPPMLNLGAKTFDKLGRVSKAKRLEAVGTGAFTGLIRRCWKPGLRNAFCHNKTRFDSETQLVQALRDDGTVDPAGDTYLLEMACECILMAREILVMREAVFYMLGRGIWTDGA